MDRCAVAGVAGSTRLDRVSWARRRRRSRLPAESAASTERALLWAFIAGLAWCPFWFGGAVLLAWGINAVLFPGLVVIYELSLLIRRKPHPVAVGQIKLPAALFTAVVLWILTQNATWTPDWLHHPIWQMAADALDKPVEGSISVDRELTSLALLRLVTAASVFWLALQLCRDAARANFLLQSVAAIIGAYAAYGLVATWLMPGRILWFKNPYTQIWPRGVVTSTFVNPDLFSAYAGTGLVLFCGLILRFYRDEFAAAGGSIRFRIASFIEVTGQKGLVLFAGAGATLIALLLTASRGGIASTGFGLCVLGALTLWRRKQRFAPSDVIIIIITIVVGALLVGAIFLVFGDVVLGKISQFGFRDQGRIGLYVITMQVHPCGSLARIRVRHLRRRFSNVPRSIHQHVLSMDSGPRYLSGGVPGTGSDLWTNAGGNRRRAGLALPQRGRDATSERDAAVRGGGRCLSSRGPCAGRLYAATAGHRYHVYGVAGGGCRSI